MNQSLLITEILPNPQGKDGNNEFIEITNFSDKQIDLKNYSLDDGENGSKPYKIGSKSEAATISPGQALTFYKSETKIALNNTNDEARLFSPTGELIDKLSYTKTTDGKSLAVVKILCQPDTKTPNATTNQNETPLLPPKEKFATIWTDPSPNNPPEIFYKFEGRVSEEKITGQANKSSENPLFNFLPQNSKKTISITSEKPINPMLSATLKQNPRTNLSILTKKLSNSEFNLIDYKILATTATTELTTNKMQTQNNQSSLFSPTTIILFTLALLSIALATFHLLKKKRKQNTIST